MKQLEKKTGAYEIRRVIFGGEGGGEAQLETRFANKNVRNKEKRENVKKTRFIQVASNRCLGLLSHSSI